MSKELFSILNDLESKLPKFDDGRIDYTNSSVAPVITVFLEYDGKILLLKRSDQVLTYKGKWNTVAGYLDEYKTVGQKAREEVFEELGIGNELIDNVRTVGYYQTIDKTINKTWIIFPALITLKDFPQIQLDFEHTEYKWIYPGDLKQYDCVFGLDQTLAMIKNNTLEI
jgi:8-oxo-dGTP pyrophosphatase MutT (NUDIX family)